MVPIGQSLARLPLRRAYYTAADKTLSWSATHRTADALKKAKRMKKWRLGPRRQLRSRCRSAWSAALSPEVSKTSIRPWRRLHLGQRGAAVNGMRAVGVTKPVGASLMPAFLAVRLTIPSGRKKGVPNNDLVPVSAPV
jgi:hypothetical protein